MTRISRGQDWFLLLALGLVLGVAACTTVGSTLFGSTLEKHSQEMAKQLEESGALVDDPELTSYLTQIGSRLVAQAESSPVASFHFAIIDMDAPNAFAIPSGHVYISRGLLAILNTEDELAGILGHEVAHVLEQHSARQAAGSLPLLPVRFVTAVGGWFVGLVAPRVGDAVTTTGAIPSALTGASYGRSQEREADEVGQSLAAAAGWDPNALARVMDALAMQQKLMGEDSSRTSWFASHPSSDDRSARLSERAGSLTRGEGAPIASTRSAFFEKVDGLVIGPSASGGVFDGADFLHPTLDFSIRFPDGDEWKRVNTPLAVVAFREEPPAVVVLKAVAEGDDVMKVAGDFEPQSGKLDAAPKAESVNGLDTAYATGGEKGGWGREPFRASSRWIAHEGLVYQVLSQSTPEGYGQAADEFVATERSFRPLAPADRQRIFEDRLRIVEAEQDESLKDLLARVESPWPLAEAAAANDVDEQATFDAGEQVKITRREVYSRSR